MRNIGGHGFIFKYANQQENIELLILENINKY